jgi:hypothetical protein
MHVHYHKIAKKGSKPGEYQDSRSDLACLLLCFHLTVMFRHFDYIRPHHPQFRILLVELQLMVADMMEMSGMTGKTNTLGKTCEGAGVSVWTGLEPLLAVWTMVVDSASSFYM